MKGTIRVDHINRNILISKAFAKASMQINSEEYKTLLDVKTAYADYSIVQREIKKNPQKESYRGLTYEYMERYIELHDGRNSKVMNLSLLRHERESDEVGQNRLYRLQ